MITKKSMSKINFLHYLVDIKHILFLKDKRKVAKNISDFKEIRMETIIEKVYQRLEVKMQHSPYKRNENSELDNIASFITSTNIEVEEGEIIEPKI